MKKMWKVITATVLAAALVAGCSAGGSGDSDKGNGGGAGGNVSADGELKGEIRFSWWGNETRNNATLEVIKLFEEKHPGVKIIPEYSGVDGYADKLMTQIAGNNAPDIFTMAPEGLPKNVNTGACLDLTGKIDVSGHNEQVVNACTIDGKMYGVNASLNALTVFYNKTLADELGIKIPEGTYTWDDLTRICQEVYEKTDGKTYGFMDMRQPAGIAPIFQSFGYSHMNKDANFPWTATEVTTTAQDIADYMQYFSDLPEGCMLTPQRSATVIAQVENPIATRETMFHFEFSGTFGMLQAQTQDELGMMILPDDGGQCAPVSARPGLIESVYSKSKNPEVAIAFLDFFVNSPEAAKVLKTVRGVLPSEAQREAVLSEEGLLSADDQKILAITNTIYNGKVNPYVAGPAGSDTLFDQDLKLIGQKVAFGELTPEQAGQEFEKAKTNAMNR